MLAGHRLKPELPGIDLSERGNNNSLAAACYALKMKIPRVADNAQRKNQMSSILNEVFHYSSELMLKELRAQTPWSWQSEPIQTRKES